MFPSAYLLLFLLFSSVYLPEMKKKKRKVKKNNNNRPTFVVYISAAFSLYYFSLSTHLHTLSPADLPAYKEINRQVIKTNVTSTLFLSFP